MLNDVPVTISPDICRMAGRLDQSDKFIFVFWRAFRYFGSLNKPRIDTVSRILAEQLLTISNMSEPRRHENSKKIQRR